MEIRENEPMSLHTTFRIGGPARFFCAVLSEEELLEALKLADEKKLPVLTIGAGSNLLVSDQGFRGVVIKMGIKGRECKESSKQVFIRAGAGEDWEKLVEEAVSKKLFGIENLSAIPGTVGASAVQNIGAYGADASQVIKTVRAYDRVKGSFVELSNEECAFSYRDSIFKRDKSRYIVTHVTYELSKTGEPNLSYKDLHDYFSGKEDPSLAEVRKAVIEIRKKKLPDWREWGTAGSYFKNPIVTEAQFNELKEKYPELPGHKEPDGRVKVSLAWILDKLCSAKSMSVGNVGIYEKQALVLVAKPGAKAEDILNLANKLMKAVKEKTGIDIEGEVEWAVA